MQTLLKRFVAVVCLACTVSGTCADEVDADKNYPHDDNVTGSTDEDSNEWTGLAHNVTYKSLAEYGPVPAVDELAKMRLTWRSAKVHAYLGEVVIQAQLNLNDAKGKPRDIDWFQGARVLVARRPNKTPDWSKGHTEDDTIAVDVVAQNDGSFNAAIPLTEIPRPIGSRGKFQFALVLASRTGNKVVWDQSRPVLAESVAMREIPGPPKLSSTLEMINAVSGWPHHGGNGMALVRAVNGLHKLGKQDALAALREYAELAHYSFGGRDIELDPANIETGDNECVFWIIRLLFEPARAGTRIPVPAIFYGSPPKEDNMLWPLFPIELVDDVPIMVGTVMSFEGSPELPRSHVNWAERYGVLRAEPLRPADDPLAVADKLLSLPKSHRLLTHDTETRDIKLQAWRMVADRLPKTIPGGRYKSLTADQWKELRKSAVERNLHWDATAQSYVSDSTK